MNPNDQAFLNIFNRHFVSLGWIDCLIDSNAIPIKDPRIFCASGVVIEYQGEWLWITAGHVLNDIDNQLPADNRRVVQSALFAGWSPDHETVSRVPFDYKTCAKYYEDNDDEGIDLGMIYIPEETKQGLVGVGVVPLQHLVSPNQEYEQYWLHGLPKKLQRDDIRDSGAGIDCEVSVMPVTFRVCPLDSGTGGFKETKRQRFYASVPAEVALDTLDGLSGGPIYALKAVGQGYKYWVAAVQNMERISSKTIAACPSALFLEILAKGFADIQSQRTRFLAYRLWDRRGRPLWNDQRDWYEAERLITTEPAAVEALQAFGAKEWARG